MRGAEPFEEMLHYEGGVEAFVRHLDKAKTPLLKDADRHPRQARQGRDRPRPVVERQLPRDDAVLHQQHPAARRRHPPGGLPRRADPGHQRLCRELGRRRSARRSRRRGEDAREGLTCVLSVKVPDPKFSLPDQGQAGLVRGAPGRRGPGAARAWPSGSRSTRPRPSRSSPRSSRPPPPARPPARPAT